MKSIGLDIGTTTISAVVVDRAQTVHDVITIKHDAFITGHAFEKIQDAEKMERLAMEIIQTLLERYSDISAIGVTGQMHGIVYLNAQGKLVSPLYTWQDGRGNLPHDAVKSWAEYLSELTGYELATGYGMVTHCYNETMGLVSPEAVRFCTIQDYIAMKLAGQNVPKMDPTNAASLGLYDAEHACFDSAAVEAAGIDPAVLPEISKDACLGINAQGIHIYNAIGDNQASFLGATGGRENVLLLNVGTGGQLSIYSEEKIDTCTLEARPYMDGKWLLVASQLCAGRSYALLERFFRGTVQMITGEEMSAYPAMDRALQEMQLKVDYPQFTTTFQGTRKDPSLRGSITNLSEDNFTPGHFLFGMMYGIAGEMYEMYQDYLSAGGRPACELVGSGNGLRKNPQLCSAFEELFGCGLSLSEHEEEAAFGAALYALKGGDCRLDQRV